MTHYTVGNIDFSPKNLTLFSVYETVTVFRFTSRFTS